MSRNRNVIVKSKKTWKIKLWMFYLYNREYEEEKYSLKNIKFNVYKFEYFNNKTYSEYNYSKLLALYMSVFWLSNYY